MSANSALSDLDAVEEEAFNSFLAPLQKAVDRFRARLDLVISTGDELFEALTAPQVEGNTTRIIELLVAHQRAIDGIRTKGGISLMEDTGAKRAGDPSERAWQPTLVGFEDPPDPPVVDEE
jgi:hypothetical protein